MANRDRWLVPAGLTVLGLLAFGRQIHTGGFYLDDWTNYQLFFEPPKSGSFAAVRSYLDTFPSRPGFVAYQLVMFEIFGSHASAQLAWAVVLGAIVSTLLYALLRQLEFARLEALIVAALVLVFPFSDATRMWISTVFVSAAIALLIGGVLLALRGLRLSGRRAALTHGGALLLYALSIVTYEVTAPLVALAGLLYVRAVGWHRSWRRWLADVAVAIGVLGLVTSRGNVTPQPLNALPGHAADIAHQAIDLLGRSLIAFAGVPPAIPLALIAAVLIGAVAMAWRPMREVRVGELRRWLRRAAAGLVAFAASYAMYVPAGSYYNPARIGIGNRINAMASVGASVFLYAVIVLAGILLAAPWTVRGRADEARRVRLAATAVVLLVVVAGYGTRLRTDQQRYAVAWQDETTILGRLASIRPQLANGTTMYTFGAPGFLYPDYPVFGAPWDLNSAVGDRFSPSLHAYPVLDPWVAIDCGEAKVTVTGIGYTAKNATRYSARLAFVDLSGGVVRQIRTRADCQQALGQFHPGPYVAHFAAV